MSEIFTVITAPGLEQATLAELQDIGIRNVKEHRGAVSFEGDLKELYKAHLWLRTPTRILRPLQEFSASHSRMLYDQVRRIRWEGWIKPGHTLAVDVTFYGAQAQDGQPGELRNSHFAALKIKDAIVDRMVEETGSRPSIDKDRPHSRTFSSRSLQTESRFNGALVARARLPCEWNRSSTQRNFGRCFSRFYSLEWLYSAC